MASDISGLLIRDAVEADVPALVSIFASDAKGGHGDTTDPQAKPDYVAAFHWIDASRDNRLFVAELDGEVVGTAQVTFVVTLTGRGSLKMLVEAVQVREDMRGRKIGEALMAHCIETARTHGAVMIALTSNAVRTDAHRFYERLGFAKSHDGFKYYL